MMAGSSPHTEEQTQPDRESASLQTNRPRLAEYVKVIIVTILVAFFLKIFVIEAYRIPTGSMENTLLVGDFLVVNKLAYGFRTPSRVPFTNVAMPTLRLPIFGSVHRGDVVVFEYPGPYDEQRPAKQVNYVKRCIGLPGDTVRIVHGSVVVDGVSLILPPHAKPLDDREVFNSTQRMTLFPPGMSYTQSDYGPVIVPQQGDTVRLDANSISLWKVLIEREKHTVLVDGARQVYIDGEKTDHYVVERSYYFMLGDNRDNSLDSRYWGFVPDDNIVGEALLVYWSWEADSTARSVMAKSGRIRWSRIGTVIR